MDSQVEIPLIPARMLNEYAYCPRLAYLEWIQNDFQDNFETVDGRYQHRVVDQNKGTLPLEIEADTTIHARSVWLSASDEFLTAKMDLIESQDGKVIPVDYKRGTVPDFPFPCPKKHGPIEAMDSPKECHIKTISVP